MLAHPILRPGYDHQMYPWSTTWAEEFPSACISLLRPSHPEQAIADLCGDEATRLDGTWSEEDWAVTPGLNHPWIMSDEHAGWTVVWEDNGYGGIDTLTSIAQTRLGTCLSMFWNVNAVMRLTVVRDGVVERSFDPLFSGNRPPANDLNDVGLPLPEEAPLPWADSPRTSGLRLIARLAGLPDIEAGWLSSATARFWTT